MSANDFDYFKKDSEEIQNEMPKDNYPDVIRNILNYISYIRNIEKTKNQKNSLLDIVYDFCVKNDYDPEEIGDIIHSDEYFTKAIMNECIANRLVRTSGNSERSGKLNDW